MGSDPRIDHFDAKRLQPVESPLLVGRDEPRVPGDIRRKDRGEPTFCASWPCRLHGPSPVLDNLTTTSGQRALSKEGPTEEHIVEELAGIMWRKRRLRLGERAAHHRALKCASEYQHTVEAALISVADDVENASIGEAIRATNEKTAEDEADLEEDQAMTEAALRILASPSPTAYSRAVAALRDDTRAWWEQQLGWQTGDDEEGEKPYQANAQGLRRFLQAEVLPWYEKRRQELAHRPLLRTQAFGEAVDPDRLERLARYETHLDRKLERMLAMLLKLQQLRRVANPT